MSYLATWAKGLFIFLAIIVAVFTAPIWVPLIALFGTPWAIGNMYEEYFK